MSDIGRFDSLLPPFAYFVQVDYFQGADLGRPEITQHLPWSLLRVEVQRKPLLSDVG